MAPNASQAKMSFKCYLLTLIQTGLIDSTNQKTRIDPT